MSEPLTYNQLAALFEKHEEALQLLAEFFGTDTDGRFALELFIKTSGALLDARVGPFSPEEGDDQ